MTIAVADVVRNIRDLPSLPVVVLDVLKSFGDADASIDELADKLSRDQALAAKALRLANSSFYGLSRKVNTIQQAITILGFDSVRTLITAVAVTDQFAGSSHPAFDFKSFWRHAIGTAVCAKLLARHLKLNQDYAFITGLLHDVGKLVLVTRFPDAYAEVIEHRAKLDCYVIEAERAVLGIDHAAVGRMLAEYWKFPVLMQRTIANHHAPEADDLRELPSVIHVADAIVHALDLPLVEDDLVPDIAINAWNSLALDAASFSRICSDTEAEFEEASHLLGAG